MAITGTTDPMSVSVVRCAGVGVRERGPAAGRDGTTAVLLSAAGHRAALLLAVDPDPPAASCRDARPSLSSSIHSYWRCCLSGWAGFNGYRTGAKPSCSASYSGSHRRSTMASSFYKLPLLITLACLWWLRRPLPLRAVAAFAIALLVSDRAVPAAIRAVPSGHVLVLPAFLVPFVHRYLHARLSASSSPCSSQPALDRGAWQASVCF